MKQSEMRTALNIDLTNEAIDPSEPELQSVGASQLRHLITTHLETAGLSSYENVKPTDISYRRSHRAIMVEGGRGSGKTTFLLSFLEKLRRDSSLVAKSELTEIARKVHVLPIVDPTLIEAKDNIIILIIQMIDAAIDDIDGRTMHGSSVNELDRAREALAEGLTMLDGIGQREPYGSQWEDANWVMSEGLRKAKKGRDFERKFNVFLEKALGILGKTAFVLAFDDVDTNFKHGHLILETIRKYLTSPRLIIILSGDLDLYGRLVRGHIYETFGQKILQYDATMTAAGDKAIQNAVRELEEQYLLKIVPPQNRIRMLPMGGLENVREIEVHSYRSRNKQGYAELPVWMSKRIRVILGEQGDGDHPFVRAIWREHLRLVLSYLRALDLAINESKNETEIKIEAEDVRASRSAVLRTFDTRLRMAGVPTDLLDAPDLDDTLRAVSNWLAEQREPATLARFGTPGDTNEAIVLHCLALSMTQGLDKSGNALKALLTVILPAIMLKRPILAVPERKRDVFSYLWNQATPLLSETAARISAVDRFSPSQSPTKQRASSFGTVGLTGRDSGSISRKEALTRLYYDIKPVNKDQFTFQDLEEADTKKSSREWLRRTKQPRGKLGPRFGLAWFTIEDLLDKQRCGDFGTALSLIFFKRYSQRGEIFRSISALSLLAVIAEMLLRDELTDLEGLSTDLIIPAFGSAEITEARSKIYTDEERIGDDDGEDENDNNNNQNNTKNNDGSTNSYTKFIDEIKKWHEFASRLTTDLPFAVSLLGTIATRIHDDLLDLDSDIRSIWGSGDIIHFQITNILNAVIAETSTVRWRKESPKSSDMPLISALQRNGGAMHPLAVILLSCPLVWIFLQPVRNEGETNLPEIACTALQTWRDKANEDERLDESFKTWTTAPLIEVKIGQIVNSGTQRKVEVHGFFDLLNVVLRYAEEAK